ncbi:MBL fold metallo-hydrolase [Gluconacetobacter tumulisoli]|uniref:MBL fold metallo-hydrolase n=1 Tax=Gluconacetobacter tumulisoli TaxID=1286189 RepID=A0A7W4K9K8_9PROT|nr:MBL fold metallo-hydrolase [Gluconacetobacter tumulisoli]MBB2202866.1 MBL fold metallo-hydrolase [Gluconacetobacter tumulisoli]
MAHPVTHRSRHDWRVNEPPPPVGVPLDAAPGIRRIVAPNPGPMTGHGTNSWLVAHPAGTVVIDPGPDDPAHLRAIVAAARGPVSHILLTHTHRDHLEGARPLAGMTGVPVCAYRHSACATFSPDIALDDGARVATLAALHTPGHASDHLCFATRDGILFTGDHIMGWSTTMVPPAPHGSVRLFLHSLDKVLDHDARLLLPAHGPPITRTVPCVQGLIAHRLAREASILAALPDEPATLEVILRRVYRAVRPALRRAAELNLLAHLEKLRDDGLVVHDHDTWRAVRDGTAD